MAIVNADTSNYDKLVNDFNICVQTYISSVDSFFKIINQTKGWEGDAAKAYFDKAMADMSKYTDFGEELSKYTDSLSSASISLISCITSSSKG